MITASGMGGDVYITPERSFHPDVDKVKNTGYYSLNFNYTFYGYGYSFIFWQSSR